MNELTCVPRLALGIAFDDPAIGGDDLGREHVIAGETPGSRQHADTAAKGESGDADGRAAPTGQTCAGRRKRRVHVDELRARAHGDATLRGCFDAAYRPGVDDQASARGPSAVAMPSAP